jgi:hypothetical protein
LSKGLKAVKAMVKQGFSFVPNSYKVLPPLNEESKKEKNIAVVVIHE